MGDKLTNWTRVFHEWSSVVTRVNLNLCSCYTNMALVTIFEASLYFFRQVAIQVMTGFFHGKYLGPHMVRRRNSDFVQYHQWPVTAVTAMVHKQSQCIIQASYSTLLSNNLKVVLNKWFYSSRHKSTVPNSVTNSLPQLSDSPMNR